MEEAKEKKKERSKFRKDLKSSKLVLKHLNIIGGAFLDFIISCLCHRNFLNITFTSTYFKKCANIHDIFLFTLFYTNICFYSTAVKPLQLYTNQSVFRAALVQPVLLVQCISIASLHFPRIQHRKVHASIKLSYPRFSALANFQKISIFAINFLVVSKSSQL